MMRDEEDEKRRRDRQEKVTSWCVFDQRGRVYGQPRTELIRSVVASRECQPICRDYGKQYLVYEYQAGPQDHRPSRHLDESVAWIVDDKWANIDRAMVDAMCELARSSGVDFMPEILVSDMLESYDDDLLRSMRDWALVDVSVDRVGAHLIALGHTFGQDEMAAIIRRFTIGMLNHSTYRYFNP